MKPSAKPLRIVLVCDGLLHGGLAKVVIAWANGLKHRGHTVGLVVLNPRLDYALPNNDWHRIAPALPAYTGIARMQRRNTLREFIASAVHSFEAAFGVADLVLAAGEECLRCASGIEHSNIWLSSHSSQLQAPKGDGVLAQLRYRFKVWRRGARLRALIDGRCIHVVSEGLADELTQTLGVRPARIEVIGNPFDVEAIRASARHSTEQALAQREAFIIGIGEFNARKAFERLIDAFHRCRFTGHLVLLGQGERLSALQAQAAALGIAHRVRFVPFHDHHYALLARARLLVMTSKSEGLANVLIEALILGVPAIAIDCPHGPREILQPLCDDALLSPSRLVELSERIDRFIEAPYAINDAAFARFAIDHVIARIEALADTC